MSKVNLNAVAEDIQAAFVEFSTNDSANRDKNNKAAGQRARATSLKIDKLLKLYRAESIKASRA